MGATMKKAKRKIGIALTLMMTAVIGLCSMITASAAVDMSQPTAVTAATSTELLLIVIIIILVIALIAGGVVVAVLLSKKKDTPVQPGAPVNSYPTVPQTPRQTPPYAAPQPYQRGQQQAPINSPQPSPLHDSDFIPPLPKSSTSPTYNPITNEGPSEITGFGTGSPGFILLRKNGGDKIHINKPEFVIGNEKSKVDYCISNNNSISRKHAKIKVRAGKCYISDLGSTNSTYINGTKLNPNQEVALIPGDKVKFSNEEFEFIG